MTLLWQQPVSWQMPERDYHQLSPSQLLLLLRAAGDVTHAAVRAGQLFGEGVDRWEPVPPRLPASQPACAMRCCGNWLMHVQRG